MRVIFKACVAYPRLVVVVAAIATALSLPGIVDLKLRTDGHALVPTDDARVLRDAEVRRTFGIKDLIAVTVTTDRETIFNTATLKLVRDLSRDFARIDGVDDDDVMSLATERRDRVWPGSLTFRTFLEPFPSTPEDLEQIRDDVRAVGLLNGTIVSYDERTTAVLVGVGAAQDRIRVFEDIRAAIGCSELGTHRVRTVGAPVAESQLGLHILRDLSVLVPVVIAVVSILIFWLTGTVWAVVVGMCEVCTTLLITFGVMGYANVPVYLTTAILPVTLTTMAIADDLHIFGHYLQALAREPQTMPRTELIVRTMEDLREPVVLTSLTTGIAFLSFAASPIRPVQTFGVFQCLGLMVAMVWSLTVTPAALALITPRRFRPPEVGAGRRSGGGWSLVRLASWVTEHKTAALAVVAVCLAATPLGIMRVVVQDSWIEGFSPHSDFYQDTAFVDRNFHGTHILTVAVSANPEGGLLVKERLERIGDLEKFLGGLAGVGGVVGPHSHLATMFYLLRGRNEVARQIPRHTATIEELIDYMKRVRGERRTGEIIDAAGDSGLVTAFLKQANYIDTRRIMAAIREFERHRLTDMGLSLDFAGDVAVSQAMIPAIVSSQLTSLLLTLAGVWLTATIFTLSFSQGLCWTLPAAAAAMLAFAIMGVAGMPLGVATSMFCAITLGVGVDYSIHLTTRCRKLAAAGRDTRQAIVDAMATSGRTISIDALAIGGGFSLLAFSSVPANAHLGCLIALSIALCYALTVLGLPALLAAWKPVFVNASE